MLGLSVSAVVPIFVVLFVVSADLWVDADARAHEDPGTPVVFSVAFLEVDSPAAWFVGCLLLWIVFFPVYLDLR
jgi:hypothetical protein